MAKRKKQTTCYKCKGELEANRKKQSFCRACHNEYMRLTRPKYSELTEEQRRKNNCKAYLRSYLKRGKIERGVCKCGNSSTQAIHEDYSKPLEVTWICKDCKKT